MSRKSENTGFICAYCGADAKPLTNGSYRNHCPLCLHSLHVDIDELLSGKVDKDTAKSTAINFLRSTLMGGKVALSDDVFAMADEQDISTATLNRAKKEAGVLLRRKRTRQHGQRGA